MKYFFEHASCGTRLDRQGPPPLGTNMVPYGWVSSPNGGFDSLAEAVACFHDGNVGDKYMPEFAVVVAVPNGQSNGIVVAILLNEAKAIMPPRITGGAAFVGALSSML